MRKQRELEDPTSCLSRSKPDELLFVLTARDVAAPHAIREWANKRIELGKNGRFDPQIVEALEVADAMERERG